MPSTNTEKLKDAAVPLPGAAFVQSLGGDFAMGMLVEMRRDMTELKVGVAELRVDVKHLTTTTESINGKVVILERKVEALVNWKNRVFGGVAVLVVLWGIFKALSGFVHFVPIGE